MHLTHARFCDCQNQNPDLVNHHSQAPNLAPSDYFWSPILKKQLTGYNFEHIEDVKEAVESSSEPSKNTYLTGLEKLQQ